MPIPFPPPVPVVPLSEVVVPLSPPVVGEPEEPLDPLLVPPPLLLPVGGFVATPPLLPLLVPPLELLLPPLEPLLVTPPELLLPGVLLLTPLLPTEPAGVGLVAEVEVPAVPV